MAVRLPTLDQINDLGADFGLVLTADEIVAFQQAFKGPLASYGRLDELVPAALEHAALSATRTIRPIVPAARPAAVRRWWPPARYRWRSAETRAARSVRRQAGVVFMA